jgi:hypothetical protein
MRLASYTMPHGYLEAGYSYMLNWARSSQVDRLIISGNLGPNPTREAFAMMCLLFPVTEGFCQFEEVPGTEIMNEDGELVCSHLRTVPCQFWSAPDSVMGFMTLNHSRDIKVLV